MYRFARLAIIALLILPLLRSATTAAPFSIVPPGIQQTLLVRAIGTALNKQLPLRLDAATSLPTVDVLPGGAFIGRPLQVTTANLQQPLAPGDYLIPVTAYCTQYSVHRPGRGVAYKIAPIQGREADALSALLWRGAIKSVPYAQLQSVQWGMQGGLTYSQMPAPYQHTIDSLIPDLKGQLQDDYVQNIEAMYQKVANISPSIPPLDTLLIRLGAPGQLLLSAKRQREIILQAYQNDQIRTQRLFDGQANIASAVHAESGPWTVAVPGVAYERFKVIEGWQGLNMLEVRVISQARQRASRRLRRDVSDDAGSVSPTIIELFGAVKRTIARGASTAEQAATNIAGKADDLTAGAGLVTSIAGGAIAYSVGEPTQALIILPRIAQQDHPCNNPNIQSTYSPDSPKYHQYAYQNLICVKSSTCTTENVYRLMLSDVHYIAPAKVFSHEPVASCKTYSLAGFLSSNPIVAVVDDATHSETNYTLPGHIFYPGSIRRRVFDDENNVYVDTFGEGVGDERELNLIMARGIWSGIDHQLSQRVARGR